MTTLLLNSSINKIQNIAASLATEFAPFFFIKKGETAPLPVTGPITLKMKYVQNYFSREMSPFMQVPQNVSLGFWNSTQLQMPLAQNLKLSNCLLLNPFKTEPLIAQALKEGLRRMLVSDISEMEKI